MNPGQDRVFVVPQPQIREMYTDYAQVQRDVGNGKMVLVEPLTEALHRLRLRNPISSLCRSRGLKVIEGAFKSLCLVERQS